MSEYIKDSTEASGWKTISYRSGVKHSGGASDGAPLTADGMDERAGDGDGDEGEAETEVGRWI